jgi:ATP-dependent RNA helicase DeaD
MLDMGFAEDLDAILEQTPKERQTALFSATMPSGLHPLFSDILKDPVEIKMPKALSWGAPRVRKRPTSSLGLAAEAALARILDMGGSVDARVLPHSYRCR